jgi:hypothetical protein
LRRRVAEVAFAALPGFVVRTGDLRAGVLTGGRVAREGARLDPDAARMGLRAAGLEEDRAARVFRAGFRDLAATVRRAFGLRAPLFGRLALTVDRAARARPFLAVLAGRLRAVERLAIFFAAMTLPLSEVDPSP